MSEQETQSQPINSPEIEGLHHLLPSKVPTRGHLRKKLLWCIDYLKNKPGEYDATLIKTMLECGMKRPDFIPKPHWNGEKIEGALSPRDNIICYQAAWGVKHDKIAEALGCSSIYVKKIIDSLDGMRKVQEIQFQIWGKDPRKWIESILPEAITTAKEIMLDPLAKSQTRLNAAQDFMDRSLGKAPQTLEVKDSNMRRIIDMMDRIHRAKSGLPVESVEGDDPIDADFTNLDEAPADDVDKFIEETYGKKE